MDLTNGKTWEEAFKGFFRPFERFFRREESRANAQQYVRGLLAEMQRKNCWQLAEVMGKLHPDGIQRLLYGAD